MSVKNPWNKRTARTPRYDKPGGDPFARFSKTPTALATVESFKARLAIVGRVPAMYRKDLITELAFLEESPRLDDLKDEAHQIAYRKRAAENGRLTRDELISLVDVSVDQGPVGEKVGPAIAGEDVADQRARELEGFGAGFGSVPDNAMMKPFVVNLSWSFEPQQGRGRGRRSPRVKYFVEGIFYGLDEESVLLAAHEFLVNHIRPAIQGGGDRVIELSDNPDGTVGIVHETAGIEGMEGGVISKAQAREEIFDPHVEAYYQSATNKITKDKNFYNPQYRYRIVNGRYELA